MNLPNFKYLIGVTILLACCDRSTGKEIQPTPANVEQGVQAKSGRVDFIEVINATSADPANTRPLPERHNVSGSVGNQYVYIEPNNTTVVAPQFLAPGSGLLTQSGITTVTNSGVTEQVDNGTIVYLTFQNNYATGGIFAVPSVTQTGGNVTFALAGNPPVNSYGAPLAVNQYQYEPPDQPSTFYTLVTEGIQKGTTFTVLSNTKDSLLVDLEGLTAVLEDVREVNLVPDWTLSTLFPASQATISFIPTTDPSNIMTTVVIAPLMTTGSQQPQTVGQSFYFSGNLSAWVNTSNPTVPAGDSVIPPGNYVYVQNTSTNNYPLHAFVSGTVLKTPFSIYLSSSPTETVITYFALPRNSPYRLSQIGFNDSNFTQSPNKSALSRKDVLIEDNGHGGVAAAFYRSKNEWYQVSNDNYPTNPLFQAGTVFGVSKQANNEGTKVLVNQTTPAPKPTPAPTPTPAAPPIPQPTVSPAVFEIQQEIGGVERRMGALRLLAYTQTRAAVLRRLRTELYQLRQIELILSSQIDPASWIFNLNIQIATVRSSSLPAREKRLRIASLESQREKLLRIQKARN